MLSLLRVLLLAAAAGPDDPRTCRYPGETYRIELFPVDTARGGAGIVIMQPQASPFGVAVTSTGRHRYTLRATLRDLPAPSGWGDYTVYVAWVTTPLLDQTRKLGVVSNGAHDLGPIEWNKFRVLVTAEASVDVQTRTGPVVLRGISPSSRMQPHDYSNIGIGPPC